MSFEFTQDNFEKLSEFIYTKVGIYLSKTTHFAKLVRLMESLSQKGIQSFNEYFTIIKLGTNDAYFEELINTITVNETYFFRENHQFETLIQLILKEIVAQSKNRTIRILSAPCSTGEEPYSIAMHLLEERRILQQKDIEIVGIDIDSTCIARAKEATYSRRSLRSTPENIAQKYFNIQGQDYKLKDEVKGAVQFQRINVFDKKQISSLGKFDVIFSRNMLIYFDDASKKEVVLSFYDMLNYGGYLLLGHAEYMSRIAPIFSPIRHGNSLAYKKE